VVTRWEVTKAVRASDLPAPARLVMLVLADVAEVGTAEIPARFTPSLVVLASETGLDRRTVQRHVAALEESGWMVRTRPTAAEQYAGERVRYRLTVPDEVVAEDRHPVVAEDHEGGGTEPPPVVAESPSGGVTQPPLYTDPSDQVRSVPDRRRAKRAATDEETVGQRVNRLAKTYTDRVKLSNFNAVAGVVRKAVNADVTDEKILTGLSKLADDSRAVTTDSLRYAIYGVPASQFASNGNGHKPYRNPTDPDAYSKGL
jgi:DNA-binding MarR family transcriptional regulator